MLKPGLYEQVINSEIKTELVSASDAEKYVEKIDKAEASLILSKYVSEILKKGLDRISEGENVSSQVNLVNKIVELISSETSMDDILSY